MAKFVAAMERISVSETSTRRTKCTHCFMKITINNGRNNRSKEKLLQGDETRTQTRRQ
jgi:hypothetical protein